MSPGSGCWVRDEWWRWRKHKKERLLFVTELRSRHWVESEHDASLWFLFGEFIKWQRLTQQREAKWRGKWMKRWCHWVAVPEMFLSRGSLISGIGFPDRCAAGRLKAAGVRSWPHRFKSPRTVSRNRWNLTTSYHRCWIIEWTIEYCLLETRWLRCCNEKTKSGFPHASYSF